MFKSLLSRSALAAVVVASALAISPPAAKAHTKVNIWIGLPGFTYWRGPGRYNGRYRDRLTCGEGRRIVDHSGYNSVSATDCVPRNYHYRARKNGLWYIIRLDARTGRYAARRA